ncbi:MAG: DNA polymerase IV [Firmicutes bacterium]|nr:DNA polymerase IV [Bacillota bacterium]
MVRSIIHVDMDAFYAAIEERDNPKLRGKPIVVGGGNPHSRGVVSTASYAAREYGIHSAMPLRQAYLRCPQATFLPVNMDKYKGVSRQIHRIFRRFTPTVEPVSLDEAFLDVTGADAVSIGKNIKYLITKKLRLTASIGISYNKFLAKLASEWEKPDGFTVIPSQNIRDFLSPLSVRRIWGVGPRTEAQLNDMGIFTIGDLQQLDRGFLQNAFGKWGEDLYDLSRGIDHRPVKSSRRPKSFGEEQTFYTDEGDPEVLRACLAEFAQSLGERLQSRGLAGRTITLKIRYADFVTNTKSLTLVNPIAGPGELYKCSLLLLQRIKLDQRKIRLIGLSVSNFIYPGEPYQLTLW